ncbi:LacI family DNA-binding transcriptional regulator [uncultured Dysosmobacter sp.]|uniref:LacI family DNA-binding transcriptional regulator n=1 Tax=uncultured Dysosmobacter sp. TaxID=2591384 RepID=UPI0026050E89|nr:LacI family DNA-binding transcriptional regulator [uncultured Dysosmobacter sp.]
MENPTIYDVSRLSGVSTATVSRAFSNPEQVREGTRRKVYEAAEVLRYSPNAIARAMARQRTDKIAYLICKKDATLLDEFYAAICEGIMGKAYRSDYQLLISNAEDWRVTVGTAQSKQIEGVILGGNAPAELVTELQSQKVAVVLVNHRLAGLELPCVISDEREGVRQAVTYLLSRGHRRIAMLAGRLQPYVAGARYNAFLEVMAEHGLRVDASGVKMCNPDVEQAAQAAAELLALPDRPTAILGANDVIAAGAIKAARRMGLRLPEDLAVVGFDDSSICTMLEPALTSVHIDCRRMGELCMERLKALLDGEEDIPRVTVVPTELKVRGSA